MTNLLDNLKAWFERGNTKQAGKAGGYHVYTRAYDRTVTAKELTSILGVMSPETQAQYDRACEVMENALLEWQTRQALAALETLSKIKAHLSPEAMADMTVTVLVDQSGSMRGQNMLMAAASANMLRDLVHRMGAAMEILGFTTVTWKGGAPRRDWIKKGRPPMPGRLCELLHIVYAVPEDPGRGAGVRSVTPMLRPDLLKENIDGEALLWAAGRLRDRPQKRKLLIIISDGAPVDDATLQANGPDILDRHLIETAKQLEASDDIELAAVGINYDVNRYYARWARVSTPDDLGGALLGLFEELATAGTIGQG